MALGVTVAILTMVLKRMSNMPDSSSFDKQIRQYEESTARLLDETRKQYDAQIAKLESRLESQRQELQRTSAIEFENLANSALERQSQRLSSSNNSQLSAILEPLKQNIGDFRKAVDDSYLKESSSREALKKQIDLLARSNAEIGNETRRLSDALRGDTRLQGKIGEIVLERMLDNIGFIKDVHYAVQASVSDGKRIVDDDGKLQRPDLIFFLPDDTKIVIDSKTSLTAYLSYCEAATEEEERIHLKAHAASVKRHIDELSRAQYHKSVPGAIEHTLMFMPNDGAFIAALRAEPTLSEYASARNVVMVSPAHLLSVLQLINQLWRIDKQNRNAEEIAEAGGKLYDKFATFVSEFESIQRNLELTQKSYDKCVRHLSEGNVSIMARAEKLRQLGAKTTKSIR